MRGTGLISLTLLICENKMKGSASALWIVFPFPFRKCAPFEICEENALITQHLFLTQVTVVANKHLCLHTGNDLNCVYCLYRRFRELSIGHPTSTSTFLCTPLVMPLAPCIHRLCLASSTTAPLRQPSCLTALLSPGATNEIRVLPHGWKAESRAMPEVPVRITVC